MSAARSVFALARRLPMRAKPLASRPFVTVAPRSSAPNADRDLLADAEQGGKGKWDPKPGDSEGKLLPFEEIKSESDLLPPGAAPGTIPTDLEQATGLERLEILGKMQGIDIFDMKPLPSDRLGTFEDPIVVRSAGEELQCGCTGVPADSHVVRWCVVSRDRPYERCDECGSVYKMEYVGPPDDPHHPHHGYSEPKTMADYVKEDYWYR